MNWFDDLLGIGDPYFVSNPYNPHYAGIWAQQQAWLAGAQQAQAHRPLHDALRRAADQREARAGALREAFRAVRRDVWHARESRLRATWESYG